MSILTEYRSVLGDAMELLCGGKYASLATCDGSLKAEMNEIRNLAEDSHLPNINYTIIMPALKLFAKLDEN